MIRWFIGVDSKELVAYPILVNSAMKRSSLPLQITPLILSVLQRNGWCTRRDAIGSTEFRYTRFLVPYLCGYQGWALFTDCDAIIQGDLAELWGLRDERFAVMVVKQDYVPRGETKFLGQEQRAFERKNWASVMLLNCKMCGQLQPEYVNTASKMNLHQFLWCKEELIGELPLEWNVLVGSSKVDNPKLLHYTEGLPLFKEAQPEYQVEWYKEAFSLFVDSVK